MSNGGLEDAEEGPVLWLGENEEMELVEPRVED